MSPRERKIAKPRPPANLPAREREAGTPVEELRDLAANAASETVRVQANRALIEIARQEREYRDRREKEQREFEPEAQADPTREYVESISDEALDGELDAYLGREIVADALEGEATSFPILAEEIRRAVECRARELSRPASIREEIEARARELADRAYVATGVSAAEIAANATPSPPVDEDSPEKARRPEKAGDRFDPNLGWPRRRESFDFRDPETY